MAFTKPKASQINFDLTNITDPLIRLNSGETGSADKDAGIIIERGDDQNVAIMYDESANQFAVVNTDDIGTTSGDVTIASYADVKANAFYGDGSNLTGISASYGDSDVGTYLSSNGYGTSSSIIASITDSAPSTLDTLNELAAALGDDANFSTTVTNSIATKLPLAGGSLTGALSISTTTTDDTLLLTTTEDSSSAAPVITLKRNSSSVADADYLGQIKFKGENDADQEVVYAKITGKILDASDGTEDGIIEIAHKKAGSNNISARFRSDSLQLINGTQLTVDGTSTFNGVTVNSSQTISMGSNRITNVADPTSAQDAATKAYVDTNAAGGGDVVDDTTPQLGGDLDTNGNDINFGDNDKAQFGTGSDLQIYHDGSNSYVEDTGTGNLRMKGATKVQLLADNNEDMLHAIANGAVEIYYDNVKKLETTSTGVDVTGTLTSDGLTVDGDVTLNDGSPNLRLQDTDTSRYIDMAYGTRAASFTNTMASGEDIDTVEPWINFRFKDDGETRTAMTIDHDGNVDIVGTLNGTASSAKYADLAERYTTDEDYEEGTVMVFGGDEEVTQCTNKFDKRIAGVISTDPAYLMNSELEGATVALVGRVPCKVIGEIRKGDLMVASDTPGHAEAWRDESNPPSGSIIGKALENKTGASTDVIEVVVGKN